MKLKILIAAISLVILAAVIGGLYVAGSPKTQRMTKLDDQRVQDLQTISNAIDYYTTNNNVLPKDIAIAQIAQNGNLGPSQPLDPETKKPYEYRAVTGLTYELCATFALASDGKNPMYGPYSAPMYPGPLGTSKPRYWNHGAGLICFSLTAPGQPNAKK